MNLVSTLCAFSLDGVAFDLVDQSSRTVFFAFPAFHVSLIVSATQDLRADRGWLEVSNLALRIFDGHIFDPQWLERILIKSELLLGTADLLWAVPESLCSNSNPDFEVFV